MAWAEKLPSGQYRGVYRDAFGKRRSAGTHSHKAKAVRAANVKEEAARKSLVKNPDAHRQTWAEWCAVWWESRTVEPGTLKRDASRRDYHLMPKWGPVPVGQITRHDVYQWIAELRRGTPGRKPVGNATIQRCVHLLSASLTAAVDAEVLQANPAARIKLPPAPPAKERYLEVDEFNAVSAQFEERSDRILAQFLVFTGLRIGEALGLHVHRLDLGRRRVTVVDTFDEEIGDLKGYPKGKKQRVVPIPGWLVDELDWLLEQRHRVEGCGLDHRDGKPCRSSLVFQSPIGTAMRRSNWDNVLDRATRFARVKRGDELVKVEPFTIHDLRHTYASWLLQSGRVDLARLQKLLGHGSIVTTMRYAHLAPQDDDAVLFALPPQRPQAELDTVAPQKPHAEPIPLAVKSASRRSGRVGPVGLEPTTRGLKVRRPDEDNEGPEGP